MSRVKLILDVRRGLISLSIIVLLSEIQIAHANEPPKFQLDGVSYSMFSAAELDRQFKQGGWGAESANLTMDHLSHQRNWPPGYREVIESHVLSPGFGTLDLNHSTWVTACRALSSQAKMNGIKLGSEINDRIAIANFVERAQVGKTRFIQTSGEYVALVHRTVNRNPLLKQALAKEEFGQLSPVIKKRMVDALEPEFMQYLKSPKREYEGTLRRILDTYLNLEIQTPALHKELVRRIGIGSTPRSDALYFIARDRSANVLKNKSMLRALDDPSIQWRGVLGSSYESVADASPMLRKFEEVKNIAPDAVPRIIARLGITANESSFAHTLRLLKGNTDPEVERALKGSMAMPSRVKIIQQIAPERIKTWYPEIAKLDVRAAWQADSTEFERIAATTIDDIGGTNALLNSIDALPAKQSMSPEMRKALQNYFIRILVGGAQMDQKQRAFDHIRDLRMWSPDLEAILIRWITNDGLHLAIGDPSEKVELLKSGISHLRQAVLDGKVDRAKIARLGFSIPKPDIHSRIDYNNSPNFIAEIFYTRAPDKEFSVFNDWMKLQESLIPEVGAERELLAILRSFQESQGDKATTHFSTSGIRQLLETIVRAEPKSDEFIRGLHEVFRHTEMRRAAFELVPEIFSSIRYPIDSEFRKQVETFKTGKGFPLQSEVRFAELSNSNLEPSVASSMAPQSGEIGKITDIKSARSKDIRTNSTNSGASAEVRTFPNLKKGAATGVANRFQPPFDIVDRLERALVDCPGNFGKISPSH